MSAGVNLDDGATLEFEFLDQDSQGWAEVALFLSEGFSTRLTASGLRWEFEQGVFLVARRSGHIVGTQGFIVMPLKVGHRVVLTGKSERTLLAATERGSSSFETLYAKATAAAENAGARLLWGITAIPTAFQKVGYYRLSGLYSHTILPIPSSAYLLRSLEKRLQRGSSLSVPTDTQVIVELSPAYLQQIFESNPDTSYVMVGSAESGGLATYQGRRARLRWISGGTIAEVGRQLAALTRGLAERQVGTLRISYNPSAPMGSAIARVLNRAPWPRRRGGGHLIVRPLSYLDTRLVTSICSWDLCGWEDVIHRPDTDGYA